MSLMSAPDPSRTAAKVRQTNLFRKSTADQLCLIPAQATENFKVRLVEPFVAVVILTGFAPGIRSGKIVFASPEESNSLIGINCMRDMSTNKPDALFAMN